MDAITFEHVSKHYQKTKAVTDLSLQISQKTVVALLGPNGAGKTTALSMMLGLTRATSGRVRLLGRDPKLPHTRQQIGAMLQQVTMPDKTSVRELIQLFRSYYRHSLETETLLELAQLNDYSSKPVRKLSGGQQRRLQFALAMAGDPRILFLDEPTQGMDVSSRQSFWKRLRQFSEEEGKTIVFTTHHLEEADSIAHRVLLLQSGRLIADGSPEQVKASTGLRLISGTAGPGTDESVLLALPHVENLEWQNNRFKLKSTNSDETLRALIDRRIASYDIEVSRGGLEDAFVVLTKSRETNQRITEKTEESEVL